MTRPVQPDLLDALTTPKGPMGDGMPSKTPVSPIAGSIPAGSATPGDFDFTASELGRLGSLDDVPEWLRFPDEPGFVEMDRNMMPVKR